MTPRWEDDDGFDVFESTGTECITCGEWLSDPQREYCSEECEELADYDREEDVDEELEDDTETGLD